jgi:hypothetical protein
MSAAKSATMGRLNSALDDCVGAAGQLCGAMVDVGAVAVAQQQLVASEPDIESTDAVLKRTEHGLVCGNQQADSLVGLCSVLRPTREMLDATLDAVIASTREGEASARS